MVGEEKIGLRAEMVVFETKGEEEFGGVGGSEGDEWSDVEWEARAAHIRRMELIRRATAPVKLTEPRSMEVLDVLSVALTRNKAQLFPTRRRPKVHNIEQADPAVVQDRFGNSGIPIGDGLTSSQREKVLNLLYTWRDLFETDLLRIRRTDLIEHGIVLNNKAKPYRAKMPLYNEQEIRFCQELIPRMQEAGLIRRCDSAWGACTKFVPKPRADVQPENDKLRMVHNFIPLNSVTEKSRYPCPRIEQIVHTITKKGKN